MRNEIVYIDEAKVLIEALEAARLCLNEYVSKKLFVPEAVSSAAISALKELLIVQNRLKDILL